MTPFSVRSMFRRAFGERRKVRLVRRRPRLAIERLENRLALAVTSFSFGVLTVDLNAASEAFTLSNNGTNITLASSALITGAGPSFTTANVNRIVFSDTGALAGQSLAFNAGTALTLSGGLLSTAVETVTFNNAITATGASTLSITAPRNIVVNANITGGSGGLTLSANRQFPLTSGTFIGVDVSGATITTTGNGNVSVTGRGGATSSSNYGVRVRSAGQITAGGSGTVTVTGSGGASSGASNVGVLVAGASSQITSSGGAVLVEGTGGGAGSSPSNYGVVVNSAGVITSAGAGSGASVTVTGQGGNTTGTGGSNLGVYVNGASAQITSSGGAVLVGGTGTSNSEAVRLETLGAIASGSNAAVTITADSVNLLADSGGINSGAGTTTIRTRTAGTQIDLGGADVLSGSPLVLGLTSAELNQITAGTLVIGRNDIATGTVTVSAAVNPTSATALQVITARNILANANITGGSGGLTLSANRQVPPTSGTFIGVDVSGATITTTGNGNVSVTGRGGATSSSNFGVRVQSAGQITAGGSGTVTVTGTGGASSSNSNLGVYVVGASSQITSSGGAVLVEGTGG